MSEKEGFWKLVRKGYRSMKEDFEPPKSKPEEAPEMEVKQEPVQEAPVQYEREEAPSPAFGVQAPAEAEQQVQPEPQVQGEKPAAYYVPPSEPVEEEPEEEPKGDPQEALPPFFLYWSAWV